MMAKIERIESKDVPYDLLFLADEDDKMIAKYRDSALFWIAKADGDIAGMIGLKVENSGTAEIVCVAVYEKNENKGLGTALVEAAVAYGKEKELKEIFIKTGNCGIKQIALYQKCGFRLHSINRDYMIRNYNVPIYENFIRCPDQVVLNYRIYREKEREEIIGRYWERFVKRNPQYKDSRYDVWNFCYGESLPNKLIGLVKVGEKKGTSSALDMYGEDEKKPEEGDLSVITYGDGLPGCIIRTAEVRIKKYCEITEEEARLEGEGDLTLKYWRDVHRHFFKMEYEEAGKVFNEEIPVIFQRFEVIYDEDRLDYEEYE